MWNGAVPYDIRTKCLRSRVGGLERLFTFSSQYEITFCQALHLVRPDFNRTLAQGHIEIRVMPFGLGHGSDFVRKGVCLRKILKNNVALSALSH